MYTACAISDAECPAFYPIGIRASCVCAHHVGCKPMHVCEYSPRSSVYLPPYPPIHLPRMVAHDHLYFMVVYTVLCIRPSFCIAKSHGTPLHFCEYLVRLILVQREGEGGWILPAIHPSMDPSGWKYPSFLPSVHLSVWMDGGSILPSMHPSVFQCPVILWSVWRAGNASIARFVSASLCLCVSVALSLTHTLSDLCVRVCVCIKYAMRARRRWWWRQAEGINAEVINLRSIR
jgi:hypothetical protein